MFPAIDSTLAFYFSIAFFAVVLAAGLPFAVRVWNDTRIGVETDSDTPEDLLDPLSKAYLSGQMTKEEYERIKTSVERVVDVAGKELSGIALRSKDLKEIPPSVDGSSP